MSVKLRKKKLADGRISLYLDYYSNGQRQYEFLKIYLGKNRVENKEFLRLADSIRAKRELEVQHSEHGFIPAFKKRLNFVDYFEKQAKGKSVGEKAWFCSLKHLKDYTHGHIQFSAVNEEWLEGYKSYLLTKVSTNTAHMYFSKIKYALRQAVKDKIIMKNPTEFVDSIKTVESERCFLTQDELQELADTPCKVSEVKRAFLFACYTGLRLVDVENLSWQNIQNNSVQFRQKKTKVLLTVPLTETARELLYGFLGNVTPLPTNKVFNLPSRMQIVYVLRDWIEKTSINKSVTFHTARHTFATFGLTQGIDLYTMSKLLGHKTISATQIYAKIVDEKLRKAVSSLPSIKVSR
jgi:site-specific recombinase XerD